MRIPITRAFVLQFLAVMASVNLSVEPPLAAQDGKVIIVQTNAAGDNISLIDAATNTVVGKIEGIEVNHGAAAAPDGSRFYISNEVEHTLDFVDARSLTITQKVSLSGRPNNVAISNDGRRVYVAIVSDPGAVDVIDTVSATNVSSIKTAGGVHNTFMTPDGRYVVAGSIAGRNLTVIDVASERALWTLPFDAGVRPMSFETSPDGSTRRIFVQLSDFHGFAIVDFKERREIGERIALPEVPERDRHTEYLQGSPSHGQGITPDGKMLWLCSKVNSHVYAYSVARSEIRRRCACGQPSRLADLLAGQQVRLRGQCRLQHDICRRDREDDRGRADSSGAGPETHHHGPRSGRERCGLDGRRAVGAARIIPRAGGLRILRDASATHLSEKA